MDQPLIAYFGQHKSGSNWIHQIMRDVCEEIGLAYGRIVRRTELDSNLSDWRTRHGAHAISWVNADWRYIGACDVRGFCVVRDPRDILVSGYFSHLKTHPTDDWPNLIPFRKKLKRVDMAEGLVLELDFMHRVWERMQHWPLVHPSVLTVRLEDFGDQYIERFESIFRFLGLFDLGLSEHSFLSIMERNSFARRSGGRSPGQEDNTSHYRKGVAGDWRNYLNEDHIALVKERLNHLLLKYEYESTPDWT